MAPPPTQSPLLPLSSSLSSSSSSSSLPAPLSEMIEGERTSSPSSSYSPLPFPLQIGSIYELRTQGFLSLKTLHFVESFDDLIFFFSIEESMYLSSPKYTISSNNPSSFSNGFHRSGPSVSPLAPKSPMAPSHSDIFAAPKGSFFEALKKQNENRMTVGQSQEGNGTAPLSPPSPGVIVQFSDGRVEEFRMKESDFMKSLAIKSLMEKEKVVPLKNEALILLDYAHFSIGQKAYYAPKNFGIFVLYEPKIQRMLWLKTYLSFNTIFNLLKEDTDITERLRLLKRKEDEENEEDEEKLNENENEKKG